MRQREAFAKLKRISGPKACSVELSYWRFTGGHETKEYVLYIADVGHARAKSFEEAFTLLQEHMLNRSNAILKKSIKQSPSV